MMYDLPSLEILLESRGISLGVKPDGGLKVSAPVPLEPELLEIIKAHKLAILEKLQPKPKPTEQPKLPLYLTAEFRPKPLPLYIEKFARAARTGKLPATIADTVVSHVGWWFVTSDTRELEALEQLHKKHYGTVQA
jgi:hypothetical protein